jgi:hypothetical protein
MTLNYISDRPSRPASVVSTGVKTAAGSVLEATLSPSHTCGSG